MGNISPKVTAATIAAALVTIATAVASAAGYELPLEVQGAIVTIIVALVGYFVTDPRRS